MKTFVRAFIMTVTYFLPLFLLSTVVSGETVTSYLLAGVLTVLAYLGLVWLYLTFWDKKPWSVMKLRVDHQAIKGFVLAASWTVIIVVASCVGAIFLGDVDKSAASWSVANLVKAFVSAFLIQGFPEEYIIPVSNAQAYKQFGNSVAVPVVAAIAKEIITVLDSSSSR